MLHVHSFRAPGGWWGGRCGFALFFFIRRCVQIERGCAGWSVILLLAKCARDVVSERQKKIQKGEEKASHGRARVHAKQTAVGVGADVDLSPRVLPLHKKKKSRARTAIVPGRGAASARQWGRRPPPLTRSETGLPIQRRAAATTRMRARGAPPATSAPTGLARPVGWSGGGVRPPAGDGHPWVTPPPPPTTAAAAASTPRRLVGSDGEKRTLHRRCHYRAAVAKPTRGS